MFTCEKLNLAGKGNEVKNPEMNLVSSGERNDSIISYFVTLMLNLTIRLFGQTLRNLGNLYNLRIVKEILSFKVILVNVGASYTKYRWSETPNVY